jgi:RNA-directed DNA polymerase
MVGGNCELERSRPSLMTKKQKTFGKIEDCWLYAISSKRDLARRMSTERSLVTEKDLENLSAGVVNYRLFSTRDGRAVQEPKRSLQLTHMRIHKLLSRVETPPYLHSARKGLSYLTNARAHKPDVPVVKVDIKKFFRSVPRVAIFRFFVNTLKCREDVAGILSDILTYDCHLPTGGSASPIISYYAFKPMFDALYVLAQENSLVMTCYVDDVTFSGKRANNAVLQSARKVIAASGLKSHKLREFSSDQPRVVTGLCNSPKGERVPNKLQLKIAEDFKRLRAADSDDEKRKALKPLLGRLEAASQIDRAFGARAKTLRAQMSAVLSSKP